jgi:NAD(P)-dependent dehydrogenase (short-subunit alcohol dehydrogenase family)
MGGKVALVTGASSGIGTAVVAGLADAGYSILAAGRDRLRTEHVGTEYPEVRTWVGDITTPESCADLVMAGIYQAAHASSSLADLMCSSTTQASTRPPMRSGLRTSFGLGLWQLISMRHFI